MSVSSVLHAAPQYEDNEDDDDEHQKEQTNQQWHRITDSVTRALDNDGGEVRVVPLSPECLYLETVQPHLGHVQVLGLGEVTHARFCQTHVRAVLSQRDESLSTVHGRC